MQIEVRFKHCNFRQIPPSKKNPDRSPLAVVEFMGGSQMVVNNGLYPETTDCEVVVEGSYMGQQFRFNEVRDILKNGKSVIKEMKAS